MNTPDNCSDDTINRLWDGGPVLPTKVAEAEIADRPEHPMAVRLFREYRAGSRIMTKLEAYALGNEINALLARVVELQRENAKQRGQLMSSLGVESL